MYGGEHLLAVLKLVHEALVELRLLGIGGRRAQGLRHDLTKRPLGHLVVLVDVRDKVAL